MKYASALITLLAGLAIGYTAGWRTAQPSEAERIQAYHYQTHAKLSRSVAADAWLKEFARRIDAVSGDEDSVAKSVRELMIEVRHQDPAHVAASEIGRCESWEFRFCPDAKLWQQPSPADRPHTPTYDLAYAQFTFVDGWVYTAVYRNWGYAWGTWGRNPPWHGGQRPEWFDRAFKLRGYVVPKEGGQGFVSVLE